MCDALLLYLTRILVVFLAISYIFLPKDKVRRTYARGLIVNLHRIATVGQMVSFSRPKVAYLLYINPLFFPRPVINLRGRQYFYNGAIAQPRACAGAWHLVIITSLNCLQ